jgi:hypothetical protein
MIGTHNRDGFANSPGARIAFSWSSPVEAPAPILIKAAQAITQIQVCKVQRENPPLFYYCFVILVGWVETALFNSTITTSQDIEYNGWFSFSASSSRQRGEIMKLYCVYMN